MTRPRVSDHALLRFLDRGGGLDVETLRARLEESLRLANEAAEAIGADDYLIQASGMVFAVRAGPDGHVVTTVLEKRDDPSGRARGHWPRAIDGRI